MQDIVDKMSSGSLPTDFLFSDLEGYSLRKGFLAGTVFFIVTGLVTGLIPNSLYVRMVPITLLDYFFLSTTSVLAAFYFGKEECSVYDDRFAFLGGIMGFLAFGCSICNAVLLAFFSSSAIMTYIDPLRPFLGVLSTLALGLLLWKS